MPLMVWRVFPSSPKTTSAPPGSRDLIRAEDEASRGVGGIDPDGGIVRVFGDGVGGEVGLYGSIGHCDLDVGGRGRLTGSPSESQQR
jgi:hypothetical protein